jgi:class 3 adenylate cyclase/tetratricopeptide (TPR) repeat protein
VEGVGTETELTCPRCGRAVSADAQYCAGCGAALVSAAEPREERKLVSILFVDLEGFTAASDAADPEDVRDALSRYHAVARERIELYGGVVEKFIGDAVMAVFGAPATRGDDAERAVRAGLRVLEAVGELAEHGLSLSARAAVNTGEAVVNVRRDDSGEALAIGDVVNTASRLQSAAPVGRLVVGAETRRATRHAVEYQPLPAVVAKGKAAPVEAWVAVRVVSEPSERPATLGPFVGRGRELDVIRSVWRQATADRRPHVVTVVGAPGIGKSRLCREMSVEVEASAGRVLRGRCVPYEGQTGYHASAQLVRQAFGIFDSDSQQVAREKLEKGVAALLPAPEVSDTARYLALVLGLDTDAPVVDKRLLFLAVRRMIERLGDQRPVLVVFEDIHWAAPSELDLLEYLGAQLRETAAVVIALARPELLDERPWGARLPEHTSITLEPLTVAETEVLVSALVATARQGDVAVADLVDAADGNPLFAEELAAALADGASGGGLPVTITAAIASRLDVLPASLRDVLLSAAVVGRSFWRGPVAAVSASDAVDEALDELERRDLIRREHASRLEGDVEYRFRHALICDVAYGTLPRAERAAVHAEVARHIERQIDDDPGPLAWILAHHWRAGGEPERALPHLLAAANVAERGWATREAVDLYSLALDLAGDAQERARIRLRRGMALKKLDADREAAAELNEILPELAGPARLDGLLYAGRALVWSERHDEALECAERAVAFAEELGDHDGRIAAVALLRNALAERGDGGDLDRAVTLGDEALTAWRRGVRAYEHADHLHLQADAKYWVGDYEGAVECAVGAREVAGDIHSAHALLRGVGMEAMARVGLGEHETALARLEEALAIREEVGITGAFLLNYHSLVFREVYDLSAARNASERALEASEGNPFGMYRRFALSDLLQTALLERDVGRAQTEWPELWRDAADATGWTRWLIVGRLAVARSEIALQADPPEEAAAWAAKAVDITSRTRRRKYEVQARSHLGLALARLGRGEEAVAELRTAVGIADDLVNPTGCWRSRAALAQGLRESGDEEGAARATIEAREILAAFASSLAPERAASLLGAPPVREILEATA